MTRQSTASPATGIPNPDKHGHWLVPPWSAEASFCEVVEHFLRFDLWNETNTVHLLACYEGYAAALEAAPTYELTYPCDWRWYEDLRGCVARCVANYQEQRLAEIQQANRNVRQLQSGVPTTIPTPVPEKKVS